MNYQRVVRVRERPRWLQYAALGPRSAVHGTLSDMQTLRPHPRPPKSETTFYRGTHINTQDGAGTQWQLSRWYCYCHSAHIRSIDKPRCWLQCLLQDSACSRTHLNRQMNPSPSTFPLQISRPSFRALGLCFFQDLKIPAVLLSWTQKPTGPARSGAQSPMWTFWDPPPHTGSPLAWPSLLPYSLPMAEWHYFSRCDVHCPKSYNGYF